MVKEREAPTNKKNIWNYKSIMTYRNLLSSLKSFKSHWEESSAKNTISRKQTF